MAYPGADLSPRRFLSSLNGPIPLRLSLFPTKEPMCNERGYSFGSSRVNRCLRFSILSRQSRLLRVPRAQTSRQEREKSE